jgi:hypothetical protein
MHTSCVSVLDRLSVPVPLARNWNWCLIHAKSVFICGINDHCTLYHCTCVSSRPMIQLVTQWWTHKIPVNDLSVDLLRAASSSTTVNCVECSKPGHAQLTASLGYERRTRQRVGFCATQGSCCSERSVYVVHLLKRIFAFVFKYTRLYHYSSL